MDQHTDQERLRGLVFRSASSPQQALAQKQLKDHLEEYDLSQEKHGSGEQFIAQGLTIQNIMDLRGGPFTLSPFSTQRLEVHNIRHLDIAVVPFWKEEQKEDPVDMADDSSNTPTITDSRRPRFTEEQRNAFKVLHDWLASFPSTTVQFFRFEWIGEVEGYNPLLFDKFAEIWNTPDDNWFSNGVVAWSGLNTLRLKGVDIKDADVMTLTKRNPGLLSLIVETHWTDEEIAAGWASANPEEREVDVLRTQW
ncbi:MAG: hypothetical protein Q9195_002448 [Heterodermia aff. obscurata]